MKEFLVEFAPFIGVGFAMGFATGVIVNVWCLATALP